MKNLLLILMLAAPLASAQQFACPERLDNARLLGGGMYHGHNKEYEMQGLHSKEPGGYNVHYGFTPTDVKWLVCGYEGRKEWWVRIEKSRATDCRLTSRGKRKVSVKLKCK